MMDKLTLFLSAVLEMDNDDSEMNLEESVVTVAIVAASTGGAELLFDNKKKHEIVLPELSSPWTIKNLLPWVRDNLLKQRPELFMQGDTVRPGILVLVNDADWELMGELDYSIQANDRIVFISTLHGG